MREMGTIDAISFSDFVDSDTQNEIHFLKLLKTDSRGDKTVRPHINHEVTS